MIADEWAKANPAPEGKANPNYGERAPQIKNPTRKAAADMFAVSENKVKDSAVVRKADPELATTV